jgi:hypothetical protein
MNDISHDQITHVLEQRPAEVLPPFSGAEQLPVTANYEFKGDLDNEYSTTTDYTYTK